MAVRRQMVKSDKNLSLSKRYLKSDKNLSLPKKYLNPLAPEFPFKF